MNLLLVLLPILPLINWPVFVILMLANNETPFSRALALMRGLSFGIGILSTVYAVLTVAYAVQFTIDGAFVVFLLVSPLYLLTVINAIFLWLTITKRW